MSPLVGQGRRPGPLHAERRFSPTDGGFAVVACDGQFDPGAGNGCGDFSTELQRHSRLDRDEIQLSGLWTDIAIQFPTLLWLNSRFKQRAAGTQVILPWGPCTRIGNSQRRYVYPFAIGLSTETLPSRISRLQPSESGCGEALNRCFFWGCFYRSFL